MALDQGYFDAIDIEVVKKKYYNANKVNALLQDIRGQAEALMAENQELRAQAGGVKDKKDQIIDALVAARALAKEQVEKAKADAARIKSEAEDGAAALSRETERRIAAMTREAEQRVATMTREAEQRVAAMNMDAETRAAALDKAARQKAELIVQQQQEHAVSSMEACFEMLRRQQEENIEALNNRWREFLCGLPAEAAEPEGDGQAAEQPTADPAGRPEDEAKRVEPEKAAAEAPEKGAEGEAVPHEPEAKTQEPERGEQDPVHSEEQKENPVQEPENVSETGAWYAAKLAEAGPVSPRGEDAKQAAEPAPVLEDLEDRVNAIAKELMEIVGEG